MLETEQNESLYAEAPELSPVDQLRQQWTNQPGAFALLKQKNTIDQNPELVPWAGTAAIRGWAWPYAFAFQGLVIVSIVFSFFNWYMTRDAGKLQDQIMNLQAEIQTEVQRQQGVMDATQAEINRISRSRKGTFSLRMSPTVLTREQALHELNATLEDSRNSVEQYKQRMHAKERELRARQSALALVYSGTPLIFSLALLLAAAGVGRGVRSDYSRNPQARNSADLYLYFATSEGLFLNLLFLGLLHLVLSGSNYGLEGLFETAGPFLFLFFWIGFYALVLRYFVGVARSMYKAMQLRVPASEWSPENRVLLRIHNNFFIMLAFLEGTFLAACYVLYHADKRLF